MGSTKILILSVLIGFSGDGFAKPNTREKKLFNEKESLLLKRYKENSYIIEQQNAGLRKGSEQFFAELIKNEGLMSLSELERESEVDLWALRDQADYDALFFEILEKYQQEFESY
jgi:hypothetical protein